MTSSYVHAYLNIPVDTIHPVAYMTALKNLWYHLYRGKLRLIEGNAKCSPLKKLACEGTLRHVFICLRSRTPYPPPPYTLYKCIHSILIHTGKGGEG
jgi:hypothetical protein